MCYSWLLKYVELWKVYVRIIVMNRFFIIKSKIFLLEMLTKI